MPTFCSTRPLPDTRSGSRCGSSSANEILRWAAASADAVHLATAVSVGADRFITNNSSDFTAAISEIAIVTPLDL